jgi:NitT/TauT family transport system substrate-binding protein
MDCVRAFLHGLQDTIDDPDAAFEIAQRMIPEMDDATAGLQRAVLQESVSFWRSDDLGASRAQEWEESVSLLRRIGILNSDLEPETLYTNKFVQ